MAIHYQLVFLAIMLFSGPAWADLVLDVRGNDPGYMQMVQPEDIQVIKVLDFFDVVRHSRQKDGFSWHAILEGMTSECRTTDRNPCAWPTEPQCIEIGTGMKPIEQVMDTPVPTVPFTAIATENGGSEALYGSNFSSPVLDGRKPILSFARHGCDELGRMDWGDGPWAVVLDAPYEAICFGVRFFNHNSPILRRNHLNFWRNNNGVAEMVGHQDLTGEPGDPRDRELCWVSEVPFDAVTTWQDGEGVSFINVSVGTVATTECERAQREADNVCEVP